MRGVRTLAKTQTNIYSRSPSQIYFMASQAHCLIFIHSQAGFLAFLLNLIACAQMQATGSRFANSGLNNSGRLKRRVPQLGSDSQETRRVLCKARMKFSALAFGFGELAGAGLDQSGVGAGRGKVEGEPRSSRPPLPPARSRVSPAASRQDLGR